MRLAEGVRVAITDRTGGVSAPPYDGRNLGGKVGDDPAAVRENRARTAAELGVLPDRVVYMRQVHSATAAYVTAPFGPDAPPLDAVYTDRAGLALGALSADCATVFLADPSAKLIGAAHSGRPGTQAGVVPALVAAMTEHGATPSRMVAYVGPAACALCYEVPAEMRAEFSTAVPDSWSTTRQGTPSVDLRAGITTQLTHSGVRAIHHDPRCTIESPELYSHRRDRPTGRFAGYIWLE